MPYWIADTLVTTPVFAWVYLGLGIPWALVLLPRADWRDRFVVLAVAFVLGPTWLTLWMFVLGTVGAQSETSLLRADLIHAGTFVIALTGLAIAWGRTKRRLQTPAPEDPRPASLRFDERVIAALIIVALVVRWFVTAYWPFIAYDTLWVYGYQGRLYSLLGYIPNSVDYYPQLVSLQYAFGQIVYGAVNDHAARAVIPFINLGSVLAVYALGAKLFSRRSGIYAAGIWTLYPHVAEWSRMGDLEIALATTFALASLFFLLALRSNTDSRRYAVLSGLILGVGMWSKPTMGALVWGIGLVVIAALLRAAGTRSVHGASSQSARIEAAIRAWWPTLRTALVVGLAAVPLGSMWYVRNVALGHNAVDFPPAFWLTQAMRSGAEFGWPLVGVIVLLAYVWTRPGARRSRLWPSAVGLALVLIALLPSSVQPRRMELWEWGLLAGGLLVLGCFIVRHLRHTATAELSSVLAQFASLGLLSLPYFATWFWSYSYHYRLSFAIVPLMLLPTAVIIASWTADLTAARAQPGARRIMGRSMRAFALATAIVMLAVPGVVAPLYDPYTGWDALLTNAYPDDTARQRSGNQALMNVVDGLQAYLDAQTAPLVVAAPGVQTLPFFFPTQDIRIRQTPTRLDDLAGVTYFVDSHPQGTGAYAGVPVLSNQVWGGLRRDDIMRYAWGMDDGIFRYTVYELHLERRWQPPAPVDSESQDIMFGDFARFWGNDLGGLEFWAGRPVMLTLYFETIQPAAVDYSLFVHLRDSSGQVIANWDGPVALNTTTNPPRYYSTLMWQPGEYVRETRTLRSDTFDAPFGSGYALVIGFYDTATRQRVPVSVDGVLAGDDHVIEDRIVLAAPPE